MRLTPFQTALISFLSLSACSSLHPEPPQPVVIQPATILPQQFTKDTISSAEDVFHIPETALGVAIIGRSRAELREGPGVQFNLKDQILPEGTKVVVIDHSSIWRRVYAPKLKAWGWLHHKTLTMMKREGALQTFSANHLPKVFAARPIETAYNFENLSELKVHIPKGTGFLKVRERKGKVLVIIPETRSLVWLAKKDVP